MNLVHDDGTLKYSHVFLASLLLLAVSPAQRAAAHGREPSLGLVTFDPFDPEHMVVRTTWAILESEDGGASWEWRCALSVGYERTTEDPPVVIAGDRSVMAGIFNGLARSLEGGCRYERNTDPDVDRLYIIDMVSDPIDPHATWAITSPGDRSNTLVHSSDDGVSWEVLSTPHPNVLLERVRVAPSDVRRVYTSGVVPRRGDELRRTLFFRSDDGGMTFTETEISLEGEERNVHVLAVDPTNPDRVLMRVVRLVTDLVPERLLLSEDGGATWETAASLLEITGVVFSDDGAQAWVGGWDGAFLRSDDRGAVGSFVPVVGQEALRVRCLAYQPGVTPGAGELWVCADDLRYDYALGRSVDGGSNIERVWGFTDATSATGCPACSSVGGVCPGFWEDVVFDLGLPLENGDAGALTCDASIDGAMSSDAGVGAEPTPPTGCGCRASSASPGLPWVGLLGCLVLARSRRSSTLGLAVRS
jgi:photosystem II stability/assembly factor-like uncharacterized protein